MRRSIKRAGEFCIGVLMLVSVPALVDAVDNTLEFTAKLDLTAPKIEHVPLAQTLATGETATITATVTDASGVQEVTLFFRPAGTSEYIQISMILVRDNLYTVTIPSEYVQGPALEYYLKAVDIPGNTVLRGLRFSPMSLAIQAQGVDSMVSPAITEDTSTERFVEEAFNSADDKSTTTTHQKWVWWALGAFAASVGAYALTRDSGDGDSATGSIKIEAPTPTTP